MYVDINNKNKQELINIIINKCNNLSRYQITYWHHIGNNEAVVYCDTLDDVKISLENDYLDYYNVVVVDIIKNVEIDISTLDY